MAEDNRGPLLSDARALARGHPERPESGWKHVPSDPARPLFRQEALARRQNQWLGPVLLEPRRSHRAFTLFAACAAAAVIALFLFRDVTRTATVAGWLVPDAGLVRVFPPQDGVVAGLHVREGSVVRRGERLLSLSGEIHSTARGSTQAEVARLLGERRRMLAEQRLRIERLLDQQQRALGSRLAALRAEQQPLEREIALQRSRLELAQGSVARLRKLQGEGFVSRQYLQQSEEAGLDRGARLAGLERERIAVSRERLALEGELNDLPLKAQTEMAAVEREIAAIDQQLAEAEARREIVVTAPQEGTVTAILAEAGGRATAAAPLLTIVPAGSRLQAQLYAPSRSIGFVRPGQAVFLRYQAYPYEKFGHYSGTVVEVSRSAIDPADLPFAGASQAAPGEALYRITVSLAEQAVAAYGQALPLQPGMKLDADLALDRRRLYQLILDPLYAVAARAGR